MQTSSTDATQTTEAPADAVLRVLRGQPADDELAALLVVLAVLGADQADVHDRPHQPPLRRRRRASVSWRKVRT